MTKLEGALAAGIILVVVLGGWTLAQGHEVAPGDRAHDDAAAIRSAVETWQLDYGPGCPTLTRLVDDSVLVREAPTDDPWGSRFRISCSTEGVTVTSAGPDKKPGTEDDVRVAGGRTHRS